MDHNAHSTQTDHPVPRANTTQPATNPRPHADHSGHQMAGPMEDHSAHGGRPGMTAADMERDMRNRFFVSLVLTVPVFLFSHLATQILCLPIPMPFGLD